MNSFLLMFLIIVVCFVSLQSASPKTDYDEGQDTYVHQYISTLQVTTEKLDSENKDLRESNKKDLATMRESNKKDLEVLREHNRKLERENASQGTKVNLLMAFAGFLLTGLVLISWYIIKNTRALKGLTVIMILITGLLMSGCAATKENVALKEDIVTCQRLAACDTNRCTADWECKQVGCNYCEYSREVPNPFTCRQ